MIFKFLTPEESYKEEIIFFTKLINLFTSMDRTDLTCKKILKELEKLDYRLDRKYCWSNEFQNKDGMLYTFEIILNSVDKDYDYEYPEFRFNYTRRETPIVLSEMVDEILAELTSSINSAQRGIDKINLLKKLKSDPVLIDFNVKVMEIVSSLRQQLQVLADERGVTPTDLGRNFGNINKILG